jgi:trigger factor
MKHEIKKEKEYVEIDFEHEQVELEKVFNKEYVNIAKTLKVNGFRLGKVPVSVAKNMIKKNEIQDKVINNFLTEETELLAIEDETYDDMEIKVIENNDTVLKSKIKMYLYPIAKLPDDYQEKLKILEMEKKENIEVTEDELNKQCEDFLMESAELIEIEEIKEKSIVTLDVECIDIDNNEKIIDEKDYELTISSEETDEFFEKEILNLKKDEIKEFNINYPENHKFSKLNNKKTLYKVKINNIYDKKIPVLDEEKVKEMFETESLENQNPEEYFRDKIKSEIVNVKEEEIDKRNYEKIMNALISVTEFNISDYVLQKEKDKTFKNFLTKNELEESMSFQDFAALIEKTAEETENDFTMISKDKISSYLILNEINKKEKIYENEDQPDIESMFKNLDIKQMGEGDFMEMIMNMGALMEDNKEDFSLSKEKIKKTITFLIDKINQE